MKKYLSSFFIISILCCTNIAWSQNGEQQEDPERNARIKKAIKYMAQEPSIVDIQQLALKYFKLHPEAIDEIRDAISSRGGVPSISIGGNYNRGDRDRNIDDPLQVIQTQDDWGENVYGGSITLEWNLPELVFNPSELQSYALVGVQLNILKEVTRIYFIRRQLMLSLFVDPPEDERARIALQLRINEMTALIDAFTGGQFSQELQRRGLQQLNN